MVRVPFHVIGNTVVIFHFSGKFDVGEAGEVTTYFNSQEAAEREGATDIQQLDVSGCEWMDGMRVESFDQALEIYQAGKDAWWAGRVKAKCEELSEACHAAIVSGCDVELADGSTEHFALAETDQINLTTALAAVERGAGGYPYHADGQMCRIFPEVDIHAIAKAATAHKLYCTTLCNHLMAWARRVETKEELEAITYQSQLPEDLEEHMEAVMIGAIGM